MWQSYCLREKDKEVEKQNKNINKKPIKLCFIIGSLILIMEELKSISRHKDANTTTSQKIEH